MTDEIFITDTLADIGSDKYRDFLAHAICLRGKACFKFNGEDFCLREGQLMIVRKGSMFRLLKQSPDFLVKNIMASASFIERCAPQSNYGMIGQLALFLNPVITLDSDQRFACERDFRWIEYRLSQTTHQFYDELILNAMQAAILDFFDFHSSTGQGLSVSNQSAQIMGRFLQLLEEGVYRHNREVSYYADLLCVTPKYLSEVSKRISGYGANYWINRYTSLDIARQLRDKSLTFVEISDMFHFSSPAYFSRYVQRNLGKNPTQYRE